MENRVTASILMVAVSVLLVGSFLVPIIYDALDDTGEFFNNSSSSYAMFNDDDVLTITFESNTYTVNGEVVPTTSYARLIASDVLVVGRSQSAVFVDFWNGTEFIRASNIMDLSLSVERYLLTYTYLIEGETITGSVSTKWVYYVANDGQYFMHQVDSSNSPSFYVNGVEDIVGVSWSDNKIISIRNGEVSVNGSASGTYSTDFDTVPGYEGVYNVTASADPTTSDLVLSSDGVSYGVNLVIYPKSVYGDNEGFGGTGTLLLVIPAIVLIVTLVGALSLIKRY